MAKKAKKVDKKKKTARSAARHAPLRAAKRTAQRRKAVKKRSAKTKKSARLRAQPWRVAYSLDKTSGLFAQINKRVPGRATGSDGSIGDAAHQSRTSDHNAWRRSRTGQPVVGAIDVTHDPRGGFDSYVFARSLVKDKRNWPSIKYVISNGQMWNIKNKTWVKYSGKNPHDHHVHVSVPDAEKYFDARPTWYFDVLANNARPDGSVPGDVPAKPVVADPILRRGSKESASNATGPIHVLQDMLGVKADGDFGPGTEKAVRAFQVARGLEADGVVGPATWRALRAAKMSAPNTHDPVSIAPTSERQILEYLVEDEGEELTVHSDEPGGASRFGVSIDTMSRELGRQATIDDLKNLTADGAWQIYKKRFWAEIGADDLPAGLNYAAFDFAVNSGPAIVDGDDTNNPRIVQDFLIQALKKKTVEEQIDELCDLRLKYMQTNPVKWERYKRGWSARVGRVRHRSQSLAA